MRPHGMHKNRPVEDAGIFPLFARGDPYKPSAIDICDGNWQSADIDPEATQSLIEIETQAGWVVEFMVHDGLGGQRPGTLHDAVLLWPEGAAQGKIGSPAYLAKRNVWLLTPPSTVSHHLWYRWKIFRIPPRAWATG